MNENTTKLIEQLATKLGTTSEYLWSVLLKQAWISSITDLVLYFIFICFFVFSYKYTKHTFNDNNKREDYQVAVTVISWVVSVILVVIMLSCIENTVSALFNPEYWALNKVLSSLK